ncbi:MAG: flippase-like domain-containing protein [Planctomycetes bacterium]|nr:flippase-like domain-containing protein [Planctomycetota bacterium]
MKVNRKSIILALGIIISAVCTWLFARKIEWHQLGEAFLEANYIYLLPATAVVLLSYVVRAIRWRILMQPIKKVSFMSLFSATSIGFMANCILPARVGEVIKPVMIGKKEKIKISASLATVLMERTFDTVSLIIFSIIILAILPIPSTETQKELSNPMSISSIEAHDAGSSSSNAKSTIHTIAKLKKLAKALTIPLSIIIVLAFILARYPAKVKEWLGKHLSILPARTKDKLTAFIDSFISGFAILKNRGEIVQVTLLTAVIWVLIVLETYFVSFSFNLSLPVLGACMVIIFVSFAVILPQAPGFVGVFHIATQKALDLFGVGLSSSQSYAIILWAVGVFPITVMGLLFLWNEGLALRSVAKIEKEEVNKNT